MVTIDDEDIPCPYEALGVERTANQDDIKRAYRKLAIDLHPDKTNGNREKEERFKEISSAYEMLSDPDKRRKYDLLGELQQANEFHFTYQFEDFFKVSEPGIMDFTDLLMGGSIFFSGGEEECSQGDDIIEDYDNTIDCATVFLKPIEFINGCKKMIRYQTRIRCSQCIKKRECSHCSGRGTAFMGFACNRCNGTGTQRACDTCRGTQLISHNACVRVTFRAGVTPGITILKGKGSFDPKNPSQNKHVSIHVSYEDLPTTTTVDPKTREVHCRVKLTLAEALCSFKKTIRLWGDELPPFLIYSESPMINRVVVVKGKGLPAYKNYPASDLRLEFDVEFPKEETLKKIKPVMMRLFQMKEPIIEDHELDIDSVHL
jgi:molecular chaperone DnaJ